MPNPSLALMSPKAMKRVEVHDLLTVMERRAKMRLFIEHYAESGNIRLSCDAAGITRSSYRSWAAHCDEEPVPIEYCVEVNGEFVPFSQMMEDAGEMAIDRMREEVRRRAVDGVDEPVYQRGECVGHVRKYSDLLLMFLLKRNDPTFKDNHKVEIEHTGRVEIDSARDRLAAKMLAALEAGAPPAPPSLGHAAPQVLHGSIQNAHALPDDVIEVVIAEPSKG